MPSDRSSAAHPARARVATFVTPALVIAGVAVGFAGFYLLGSRAAPSAPAPTVAPPVAGPVHGHGAGSALHAPNVQSFADSHVEACVTRKGEIRLLILDEQAKGVRTLEEPQIVGELQPPEADPVAVTLEAKPQDGDSLGESSRFVGEVPDALKGRPLGLSVTVRRGGARYRLHFGADALTPGTGAVAAADAASHPAMPSPLAGDAPEGATGEERALFLTPGGAYTAEDIAANGGAVASQKFSGLMASHDMNPRAGDLLCPITNTKADARFTWVVAGEEYRFCCPPCVEEFVKRAKEDPASLKDPEAYRKK